MNTENEPKGANDGPAQPGAKLASVMKMLAYRDVTQRFHDAMVGVLADKAAKGEAAATLVEGAQHLQQIAVGVDPTKVLTAALIVVTEDQDAEGRVGYRLNRGLIGSNDSIAALLPLVHLLFEFERDGVLPPELTGMDVEVEQINVTDAEG